MSGRKRHIAVDTLGLIHALSVHAANVQDLDGAKQVLAQLDWDRYPRLETVWADAGYQGKLEEWSTDELGLSLQIVPKLQKQRGFVVLAKRWIEERTFAWLGRYRRLSKDHEAEPTSSESWIRCVMIHLMVRRLAPGLLSSHTLKMRGQVIDQSTILSTFFSTNRHPWPSSSLLKI